MNILQSPNVGVGGKDFGEKRINDFIYNTACDYDVDYRFVECLYMKVFI